MDLCLIAASEFSWLSLGSWGNFFQLAVGLGVVIFVHELGHFLVAKACGVKCEKFYLGFDVPMPKIGPFQIPSKLVHFQYGETEYGIGIVPLGGYVKMLGQDDNPANAEKEAARTRVSKSGAPAADHHESITDVNMEPQPLAEQLPFDVDPRSYTAKNVPQRMAIISAGVIMNVIFAVIFATIAYKIGVPYTPTFIGGTQPGSPAWINQADLPSGALITQVGKKGEPREHLRFLQDFRQNVMLHGFESPLPILVQPHVGGKPKGEPVWVEIQPEGKEMGMGFGKIATIGIQSMPDLRIAADKQVVEGFPAALAKTTLVAGDKIVSGTAGGETTEFHIYPDLQTFLARHADDEVTLTIKRTLNPKTPEEKIETHTIELARRPLRTLGIAMTMGPISAIQAGSPAAKAGVKKGDVLEAIDGEKIADPMLVSDLLRRRAGEEVTLTVLRGDGSEREPKEIKVTPREVRDYQSQLSPDEPVLVDSLGIAFRVDSKVASVSPNSDAYGKLQAGDLVTHFRLVPAGKDDAERAANLKKLNEFRFSTDEVSLVDGKHDWPAAFGYVQWVPDGTQVKLSFTRDGKKETVEVTPRDVDGVFFAGRGLVLDQLNPRHTAKTWGEAFQLGRRETWESLGLVVTFLKKLVTGRIALTSLGGPGTIVAAGTSEASRGPAALLIFLTMLSANLAVVNFLPIPVLDGGHMMFLAYEGIFRRPVNEKWQIRLSLLGLSFVLCLMVFVIGLDFYRLSGIAQ